MIIETGEINRIIGINDDEVFQAELLQGFLCKDEIILFPWRSINLNHRVTEKNINGCNWNNFVLEHTVIKSKENPFGWNLKEDEYYLWYSPNNKEDLKRIIKFEWLCYTCCIVKRGDEINNYKYLLEMYEHDEYKEREYRSLFIRENQNGNFSRDILPIVKPVIEKYDEHHQYRHNKAYFR